nr:ureidoglycolate lyase [Acinetobacter sp. Marseille-Q1620]
MATKNIRKIVHIQELNSTNFNKYGEVIECNQHDFFYINQRHTERYHAIAEHHVDDDAHVGISIFRNIKQTELPFNIQMLERHPLGSQAFIPMAGQKFLIIVAPALTQDQPDLSRLQAFISNGTQGVNYQAGTWHHPLLTLEAPSLFSVIDRIGDGNNCDVYNFPFSITVCP